MIEMLDAVRKGGTCPGFYLWDVIGSDGNTYRMAADYDGGAGTRLYFRTDGEVSMVSASKIGPNPAVKEWEALN